MIAIAVEESHKPSVCRRLPVGHVTLWRAALLPRGSCFVCCVWQIQSKQLATNPFTQMIAVQVIVVRWKLIGGDSKQTALCPPVQDQLCVCGVGAHTHTHTHRTLITMLIVLTGVPVPAQRPGPLIHLITSSPYPLLALITVTQILTFSNTKLEEVKAHWKRFNVVRLYNLGPGRDFLCEVFNFGSLPSPNTEHLGQQRRFQGRC